MKVLLVAPTQPDLPNVLDEVQDIVNSGLSVHPLLGQVRHVDVLREITLGKYDVLWLATHGNTEGVLLSDGLLPASLLTSLTRGRVRVVILNTCSSVQAAQMIQNETRATVICTVADVPDREAYQTGALLARALADTGRIDIAYERSRPGGNRTYLLLAAQGEKMSPDDTGLTRLSDDVKDMASELHELRVVVALLKQRIEQIEKQMLTILAGMAFLGATLIVLIYLIISSGRA
jgi:hypothetical protein